MPHTRLAVCTLTKSPMNCSAAPRCRGAHRPIGRRRTGSLRRSFPHPGHPHYGRRAGRRRLGRQRQRSGRHGEPCRSAGNRDGIGGWDRSGGALQLHAGRRPALRGPADRPHQGACGGGPNVDPRADLRPHVVSCLRADRAGRHGHDWGHHGPEFSGLSPHSPPVGGNPRGSPTIGPRGLAAPVADRRCE